MVYKYFFVLSYHLERLFANFNIAETSIFLRFQHCLDEVTSQNKAAPACPMYTVNQLFNNRELISVKYSKQNRYHSTGSLNVICLSF
jgi:hypothetical protein